MVMTAIIIGLVVAMCLIIIYEFIKDMDESLKDIDE